MWEGGEKDPDKNACTSARCVCGNKTPEIPEQSTVASDQKEGKICLKVFRNAREVRLSRNNLDNERQGAERELTTHNGRKRRRDTSTVTDVSNAKGKREQNKRDGRAKRTSSTMDHDLGFFGNRRLLTCVCNGCNISKDETATHSPTGFASSLGTACIDTCVINRYRTSGDAP